MWQEERNLACPGCAQPRDEVWVWDPSEQTVKQQQWEAHMRLCVACAARDYEARKFREADNARTDGIYPVLNRTEAPGSGVPPA